MVKSKFEGQVYVGITKLGPVNEWLEVSCALPQAMRLGKPNPKGPVPEYSPNLGKSVKVPCQGQISIDME